MSERWLITGASGFLGRHVVAALEARELPILTLDRSRPAREGGLVADLAVRPPDLGTQSVDVVVHLASLVHHDASSRKYERVIVEGTRHLLASLERREEVPGAILYASSIAVYGIWEGELLPESTPARATSPYGESKRRAEELILEWARRHGSRAVILRLPALIGRGMVGSLASLAAALRRPTYVGLGAGEARRSFVLADDVAAAMPRLGREEGIFHLTDRVHPTFRRIETVIRGALGRRPPPRLPLPLARGIARGCDLAARLGVSVPFSSESLRRATSTLTFDDTRAVQRFGWAPRPVLEAVDRWLA